jgi:hypothetical protein
MHDVTRISAFWTTLVEQTTETAWLMRQVIGVGTPRGLQSRLAVIIETVLAVVSVAERRGVAIESSHRLLAAMRGRVTLPTTLVVSWSPRPLVPRPVSHGVGPMKVLYRRVPSRSR